MVYRTRQSPSQIVCLLIMSPSGNQRRTGSSRVGYALVECAIGQSSHRDPSTILKSDLSAHVSGKPIHDQISDERIVQCLRIIRSPKMRVTIIIFHMAHTDRYVLHKISQEIFFDEVKFVDLHVSPFYIWLRMVP